MRASTYGVMAAAFGLIATPNVGHAAGAPASGDSAPITIPPEAAGKVCCPGTDHTVQLRGVEHDLSIHPYWKVFGIEQDGTVYYQVNDVWGREHLVVGGSDGVYEALHADDATTRLRLPTLPLPANGVLSLHLDPDSDGFTWRMDVDPPEG